MLNLIPIVILIVISIAIWNGHILSIETSFFSTEAKMTSSFQDYREYTKDGVNYKFIYWIRTSAEARDGFLAGNPFHLRIGGFIDLEGNIPEKEIINMTIIFKDVPRSATDDTEITPISLTAQRDRNDSSRYIFTWEGDLVYYSSGPKRIGIIFRNIEEKPEGFNTKEFVFLDMGPPYVTTQLKLTKATVILTIWIAYLTFLAVRKEFMGRE